MTDLPPVIQANPKLQGHFEIHRTVGKITAERADLIPLFYDLWWSARNSVPLRDVEPEIGSSIDDNENASPLDVLFIPLLPKNNFLGACEIVANALDTQSDYVKIGFLKMASWDLNDTICDRYEVVPFGAFPATNDESDTTGGIDEFQDSILSHPLLMNIATREEIWRRQCLHQNMIKRIRTFLRQRRVKIVLMPNEFLQASSLFLAAAKLEGVFVAQLLHGTPVRFYAPFYADEMWVWSARIQQRLIEFGATIEKLAIVGNLEVAYHKSFSEIPDEQDLLVPRPKVLLFFMQDISKGHYLRDLALVRDAFSHLPDEWSLRIRITDGYNSDEVMKLLNEWFGNFDGRVMITCNRPLMHDLFDADITCAGSTSASFTAMGLGYPMAVLWNDDLYASRGEAMVNPQRVCRSPDDLVRFVCGGSEIPAVGEDELAHVHDSAYAAASRILNELLKADT